MASFRFEVWPTEHLRINQYFGVNPQNYAQFGLPGHEGIDIEAPTGSKIFCVAPGEVIRVRTDPQGHNYGIHVRVQHDGGFQTTYAHMEKALVAIGQIVEAGAVLGRADNTGNSFGSHLHLTLKKEGVRLDGWPAGIIDPLPYLLPLLGWEEPAGPYIAGWILSDALTVKGPLAQAHQGGATLRVRDDFNVLVPGGTMLIVDGEQQGFSKVRVARVAVGLPDEEPPEPAGAPPPTIATLRGWIYRPYLTLVETTVAGEAVVFGVAGPHGVNLRLRPERDAPNVGLLKAGSTVTVEGAAEGDYLPVSARRSDFLEPVALPEIVPATDGLDDPDALLGWVLGRFLTVRDRYAQISRFGVNLRSSPEPSGKNIGLVKGYATVLVAGYARGEYLPIRAGAGDVLNVAQPLPAIDPPKPLPAAEAGPPPPGPLHDTTPGWLLSGMLSITDDEAVVGSRGANLRNAPRRDADVLGFVPPAGMVIVTGRPRGEFTPVRVDDDLLQDTPGDAPDPDPQIIGEARLGLHASADPDISYAEFEAFRTLRPSIIKVLSFHSGEDLRQLAADHPQATFVVRAFLDFGGRPLTPNDFYDYTISDVERALSALNGRNVVVELHNEPNVVKEGLGSAWSDGATFAGWWLKLLARYRQAFPQTAFVYPGLSPGATVSGVKIDHVRFLETSRDAAEAADGLGLHVYWSGVYPMSRALDVVDDYISRFRARPLWITEASNNGRDVPPATKAREYLSFWQELHRRPMVKGVTYFVASASNPDFAGEVWVGRGIADIVGLR